MAPRSLAILVLACAACTSKVREVHLERGNAFHVGQGEATGRLYLDGRDLATCNRSGALPQVICDLDVTVFTDTSLIVELAVVEIGLARTELHPRAFREGAHFAMLESSDGVVAAGITFSVRVEPILPMRIAVVLYILLGIVAAFVAWAALRSRFLTPEDERVRRSVALITAIAAVALSWIAMMPLAERSRELDPTVLAIPSGLGAYALAAVLIDGIARRRASGKRILLALVAVATIAMLPWAMTIKLIPTQYVVIATLIAILFVLL